MTRRYRVAPVARILACCLLGASVSLLGCDDSKEWKSVKTESGDAWNAAKAWGITKRQDAERFYAKSMDDLPKQVEAAKVRAHAAGSDASRSFDAKWEDLSHKLADLKAAGADRWEAARGAFVRAYESLEQEVNPRR